jgi:DNA topoisomerase IA
MMRNPIEEFLETLRSVFRTRRTAPASAPAIAFQDTGHLDRRFVPPDLSMVAERSPAIAPAVMAAYWREALAYLDFAGLARSGPREIKPLRIHALEEAGRKAGLAATDVETAPPAQSLKEVNVVLCLWEADRSGVVQPGKARHPLLNVPALVDQDGLLTPRVNAMPELNARYLDPDVQPGCFALAPKQQADEMLLAAIAALAEDKTAAPGWTVWWQACRGVLHRLTGCAADDAMAAVLGARANEVRAKGKAASWTLCAAVYEAAGGGAKGVAEVYDNIVETDADGPAGLFHRLCGKGGSDGIGGLPEASQRLLHGHIDEYDADGRALFPLDETQRTAVRSILSLGPGQLQAVNGPPGSGKTAMLRAVVASKWVGAALAGHPCPIVVACGATNQSVTNVIEAFGKAPHPDDGLPHAQRWIEGAPSYGAFLPSSSYKADARNRAEINRIVCIEKVENPANAGFLYRYFQRTNILDPAHALSCEGTYLKRARHALDDPDLPSVEEAVWAVWQRLRAVAVEADACLDAAYLGDGWTEAGERHMLAHGVHWAKARKKLAMTLLATRGDTGARVAAAAQFIDLAWRAEAFHWAARYWEGRFLLAQRERLLSRHPLNVEEALRRLCMLTPCLVSTLHTVPQFAQIDAMATGQDEVRSHVYGVVDLLVLDEAGQALPELAGAAFALAKTAAVVGDLKQLAPVASNTRLAEIGIARRAGALPDLDAIDRTGRSVVSGSALAMARRVSRWKEDDDGVSLRGHYRCKPSIIEYCNLLCYDGLLRPRTREDDPFPEPALGWANIDAAPALSGGSQSNRAEAEAIVEWIVERWPAWQSHPATRGKPLQDIVAIVTPYRAQADILAARLQAAFDEARRIGEGWPDSHDVGKVTIGTVHRLQGAERPIVCFSLVEGPEQGAGGSFIDRDATLMNVAVSRARSAFIMFANPERLFPPPAGEDGGAALKPVHLLGAHLKSRPEAALLYPKKLVLIEAGGKLGTLRAMLGKASALTATGGALWNLPLDGGVDIAAGLVPRPTLAPQAQAAMDQARKVLGTVGELVFATDDDRMGEYIAWQARQLLGADADGKRVGRARLGAITPAQVTHALANLSDLDDDKVLAEAVREVADWMMTRRFARLTATRPACAADDVAMLRQLGVCTEARIGQVQPVGRVQAAVLRLLLGRGRQVVAAADQYRIKASVDVGGRRYTGYAFILEDGRELTSRAAAERFVAKADGTPLVVLGAPEFLSETCSAPLPGTIEILARAWERFRIAPWDAMALLQALYDGSWSGAHGSKFDIEEPVPAAAHAAGHPPLRPLDRSATPEQMRSVMSEPLHQVYSIVWDYFLASEQPSVNVSSTSLKYRVTEHFGVRFDALDCRGLDDDLLYVMFDRDVRRGKAANRGIGQHRMQLTGTSPVYSAEPAFHWDVRPDQLLLQMAQARIGRPSTYAGTLRSLATRNLVQFPDDDGPLRLSADGLATALALEQEEAVLSAPGYSAQLLERIERIETGACGPRDVLLDLLRQLAPEQDWAAIGPRIWNSLDALQAAMAAQVPAAGRGPLLNRGDAGVVPDEGAVR